MGQSETTVLGLNNNIPAKDIILEYKLANEIKTIIDLDLKEAEDCENEIRALHLEVSIAKSIEQLDEIEAKYEELKTRFAALIGSYKNMGLEAVMEQIPTGDVGKTLGRYKAEKENEYIIARITHQDFNIPMIMERIITLENIKDSLEEKLAEKKMVLANPEKKWDVADAKTFNINNETLKLKSTFEQQEKFIELVKEDIINAPEERQIEEHLKGIENLLKKLSVAVEAYMSGVINKDNIIGLSISAGMINNLTRGLVNAITLENKDSKINYVSYGEEIKKHLGDFILIDAVNSDAILQLQLARVEMDKLFGGLVDKYPLIVGIVGEMIRLTDLLKQKETKIFDVRNG